MSKLLKAWSIGLMLSCFFVPVAYSQNNNQPSEAEVLKALLNEVKLLRQMLQNGSVYACRGQILVEQVKAQRDRVFQLNNTLDKLRTEINTLEFQVPHMEERVKDLNEKIYREADFKQRAELEGEARAIKQAISIEKQRSEEMRKRETQLAATLTGEQAKLGDLERRLEAVENELERNLESQKVNNKKEEK